MPPGQMLGTMDTSCNVVDRWSAMGKDRIIEALGERHLLLPGLIARALAANDRVKYLLTLLQTARTAADGATGLTNLQDERVASGVDDAQLDRVVSESSREGDGWYRIPGAELLSEQAILEVRRMLAPLEAAAAPAAENLADRVDAVTAALRVEGDRIATEDVVRLTAPRGTGDDSLHLVVMDAHRELNALEARIASDSIDGARVHDLDPGDAGLVHAFMRGVHATERLRFDHPGLGTVATRTGSTVVIQNDLGETDAHVVVIRVTDRAVTINYTDVHLIRLVFFQDLLAAWPVAWEDTRSRSDKSVEGGLYHLASGRFEAAETADLDGFLEHLGSRLVFMIDWNRARKRLRRLVGRRAAIDLLRWAAERGYGHMAFLRAGADGLVYDALEFAGGRVVRAGESLEDVLGADAAQAYLRSVLKICSEGLLDGKLVSLIQDEVRAELTGYLRSARQEILGLALRHAEVSVEIAEAARDALEQAITGAQDRCHALAAQAQLAEHDADELVGKARIAVARAPDLAPFLELVEAADDIADCAEEAAFYATLLPRGHPADGVRPHVRRIARLVLAAAREYLRAVQLSIELRRGGPRGEMDAFLEAAHQTVTLERDTDEAQRGVHQAIVADGGESGASMFVVVELTRAFEEAADALMHSAHLIRTQTLARVVGSEPLPQRAADTYAAASRPAVQPGMAGEHLYVLGDSSLPIPAANVIGGKAYGLARIARAGLPVPEGVVLTTELWRSWVQSGSAEPAVRDAMRGAVDTLERRTGLRLGSSRRPLLLSVRSGAPISMPGMLETVLDVGLCDGTARGLIALTGNPRLAWDSYRRLIESYATVVNGCPREPFDQAVRATLAGADARTARELTSARLEWLTRTHLDLYAELTGSEFPQDPIDQLDGAVAAVLASWNAPKAEEYRRLHGIDEKLGTAVLVQRMVFGNAGGRSGTGVGFTRDPSLGASGLYVDFLVNAQGEDVVAGRQPLQVVDDATRMEPVLHEELERAAALLESQFGDAQEFEFTVQDGELFLLQTRTAKRTPWAALQIGVDQVAEGLITPAAARERLAGIDLSELVRRRVSESRERVTIARAVAAGSGVASGPIALDADAAARMADDGRPPVVVLREMSTDEIAAISRAAGILTAAGGRTSHAAVVARELGTPCLVGCRELAIDLDSRTLTLGSRTLAEGDVVTLDGESGLVYAGAVPVVEERPTHLLAAVEGWGNGRTSSAPEPAPPDGPRASTARAGS